MIDAFRLVKARYANTALDGSGAKAHGGRWNSRGVGMVYAADSIALAVLELLVHLHRGQVLNQYRLFTLSIPESRLMRLDERALPADWQGDPPPSSTAAIGDEWLGSCQSLVLSVPSVLVPQQRIYLLNSAHPDFDKVAEKTEHLPFAFDARLTAR